MPRIGTDRPAQPADISITGLGKSFGTGRDEVLAMADVDLEIAAGEFVAVVGASGCGKSTLLRILAGFEPATRGTVSVAGEPVDGPGPDRGVVFQDYGLFPWLTVAENIAYGPRQKRYPGPVVAERAAQLMETVGLSRFARSFPGQLSGGMQQRVAIARVLANDPAVLLMDEPFGALDALTRTDMQAELTRIHAATGTTVVFVTHSIEEAVFLANRVVVMAGGASHGVPGHVREVVPIDLGPDRDPTSPEFNAHERRLSALVHQGAGALVG
jgi:ABC-type nitrate/sulfonate/bicarbonate transport system ATPase subunit